uniref:Uncharacterized protein n=1 Tax=Globodera pallida TaxID=36090 RepID=A0A183BMB0_GLOPA
MPGGMGGAAITDASIFGKWVLENWQKPLPTPPGGSPPKNHHALVHEVRRPIPVIGREIPPPQNYGKEPPPTGFEPDNDEGFGEQMDVDEDFLPPPPPPSPPHVVLRPIGYGRPQQRPATSMTYLPFPQAQAPQPLYLLPLPRAPQQQFNIQPPNPQMLAQLFRFLTPAGHAHWQHPMQNPALYLSKAPIVQKSTESTF